MKTTEENNRLIAEFMGYEFKLVKNPTIDVDGVSHIKDEATVIDGKLYFDNNLRYHSSWDWLMPVVEKIETIGFTFEKNYQRIDGDWQSLIVKGNDILFQDFNVDSRLATHYVVCEFIQWYNENK
jgi:hypothetical protein